MLDGDELTLPFNEMTLFEGMESKARLLVEPRLVRKAYLAKMAEHQEEIRRRCLESQVGYQLVDTREAPGDIVLRLLKSGGADRKAG